MRKLNLILSIGLVLGLALAATCGPAAPVPTPTVTVTKTVAATTVTVTPTPGVAPTVTVTTTAPAVTVTVTPTPTPTKLVKVRAAKSAGGLGRFFDSVGIEKGLFQKRGIDLEIQEMAAAAAKSAPFIGLAETGDGEVIPYYPERKDPRYIGPWFSMHTAAMVRKDSPYRSYSDLKGKKMSFAGPNVAQLWPVKIATKMEGLDLEKDFQLLYGVTTVQIGWLLKGDVDAIHIAEPYPSKLLVSDGDKVRELYWLNDLYRGLTGYDWLFGIFTSDAWVKQNPEVAKQLSLALGETMSYVWANEDVWRSDLSKKFYGLQDPREIEMVAQRLPRIVQVPPYGPTYKSALIRKVELMAEVGIVPRDALDWFKKDVVLFAQPW